MGDNMFEGKDTVTIAWCDNGLVDGKFAHCVANALIECKNFDINIVNTIRVLGNQIARQRQTVYNTWKENPTDWILWIDSDILFDSIYIKKIIDSADENDRPVVSGLYFISKNPESSLMEPTAAAFINVDKYLIKSIHPIPENEIIEIDNAGMGFVLMNKSIIEKIEKNYPNEFLFKENEENGDNFIGEDIAFFRKLKNIQIPIYLNTEIKLQHLKKFPFDLNYYLMYWDNIDKIK